MKGNKDLLKENMLDLDQLENVSGGANPFDKYQKTDNQEIDDDIKDKV